MRVKVRLEKSYTSFHQLLPKQGDILDVGCGYGFMSYILHFTEPARNITGIDYDEEKTTVAAHCFSKDEGINFEHADIATYNFAQYDGIIMADMLHYLQPEQQHAVIKKAMHSLKPNGTLIIRDGDKEREEKHKGTKLTEFFSTKLFGFNKTTGAGLSFLSASTIHQIANENGMHCREIDETRYTSNVVFVITHNN